ncbi:MAG: hypothetical protein C5B50_00655 [Verrucomicrobia bacterium]|nr:MAG: hypothetical protein C5B50_00655 [Verrucomicrobiota bacterium]
MDDDAAPVLPGVISAKTKNNDQHYRDQEAGSEMRAQMAAELMGVTPAETGLRITNMRDGMHEGDIAAPAIDSNNQVHQYMQANPTAPQVGFNLGHQAVMTSPDVQSGPFPNAGVRVQQAIRREHGRFAPHAKAFQNENPTLETQQPNYRPRV